MSERFSYGFPRPEEIEFSTIASFAATAESLDVGSEDIHGDVLIGGHGMAFPERLFVCTQESSFRNLRHEVKSLTCCDFEFNTSPELLIDHSAVIKHPSQQPRLRAESVNYYPHSLQMVIPLIQENTFDTAMFFRIPNLHRQFGSVSLMIQRVLKSNGLFLGSGSFEDEESFRKFVEDRFQVRQVIELPNPDYSGYPYGYTYSTHFGFVLEKE